MLGDAPWQKLERGAEGIVPLFIIFFFTLLGMVPLGPAGFNTIIPPLGLMALFYWAAYRPDLVGPFAAFLAGFLTDALTGGPLGAYSVVFLLVHGMVTRQRQLFLSHSFFMLWWGFAFVAVLAGLFGWLVMTAVDGQIMPIRPVFFQALTAMALFPLMAGFCGRIQRAFLGGGH